MGERDAFGRETGEDPLAAMGWGAARAKPADPVPPPAAAPEDRGDLFLAGGTHYRSDLAGRHIHRVG
jgi:hypothetical protein